MLLGAFVWAMWITQRAGVAAIAAAIGLALAFLILIGLTLAVCHVRSSDATARLLVGAQQPRGRGPASLRITVTQAGVTVAVWKDVHLAPGQTWRARPLTGPGSGPATVVARRGGVVVASFPAG